MGFDVFPTRKELEKYAQNIPEIEPSAVLAMLRISQAAEYVRAAINDVLASHYHLSRGKLRVMFVLYQMPKALRRLSSPTGPVSPGRRLRPWSNAWSVTD